MRISGRRADAIIRGDKGRVDVVKFPNGDHGSGSQIARNSTAESPRQQQSNRSLPAKSEQAEPIEVTVQTHREFKLAIVSVGRGPPTRLNGGLVKKKRKKRGTRFFTQDPGEKRGGPSCGEFVVTSVKQPAGCRRIDDPGRRDTQRRFERRREEEKGEEEEEEEEASTEEALDGKGAAVGQVKWRVPAGFYAALATGPPCRYLSLSHPFSYRQTSCFPRSC
ncbi:hypothetical protein K0M31_004387 [Melipona bicolor]|uniref:Uncharacterized protein n=1 Tax=Melipona bicolor TaxID=60889 RepID=A0AA40FWP0_9HYME|nr:hypothetical protein K0M31_004387 [Melipona bicolor]